MLVEIISMLILLSARTLNIFAAIPGLDFIPAPTSEIVAMFVSQVTPLAPTCLETLSTVAQAAAMSALGSVKETSVVPAVDVFYMIMSTFTFASASGSNSAAETPGWSGTPSTVIFASLASWTTPEMIGSSMLVAYVGSSSVGSPRLQGPS